MHSDGSQGLRANQEILSLENTGQTRRATRREYSLSPATEALLRLPRVSLPLTHTPRVFPILPLPHLIAVFEPQSPFCLSREATQPDLCSPQSS